MSMPNLFKFLGYAGLVPFFVPAIMLLTGSEHSAMAAAFADTYAFGIVSFLTGTWWGVSLNAGSRVPLLLSNLLFLLALALFVLVPAWWAFAAAALLALLFFVEIGPKIFPPFPLGYRTMRAALTLGASGSMFAIHLLR